MDIYVSVILFFIIVSMAILQCDLFDFREKLSRKFLIVLNLFIPDDESESNQQKIMIARAAAFLAAVVILVFLITVVISGIIPHLRGEGENKLFGPVGDLFNGVITPILTFLTFCGLLITILIQNVQMKATLKELRLTQEEARKSSAALEAQVKNSELQKFDNNFFSLLDNHKKLIDDFQGKSFTVNFPGYETSYKNNIFKVYHDKFSSYFENRYILTKMWDDNKDQLLSFLLINFNILSYLDKHLVDPEMKILKFKQAKSYSNILRATLSSEIIFSIFVNVSIGDFDEYRKLIEKYALLEHMRLDDVYFGTFLMIFEVVDESAFGDKIRLKKYVKYKFNSNEINILGNKLYNLLLNEMAMSPDEAKIICGKLLPFIKVNYSFDEIFENLKVYLYSDYRDFFAIKGLTLEDLINFKE